MSSRKWRTLQAAQMWLLKIHYKMSKALQQLVEHIDLRAINNKQEPPLEGDQQDDVLGDGLDTEFWIKVSFVKCTQRKNSYVRYFQISERTTCMSEINVSDPHRKLSFILGQVSTLEAQNADL